MDCKIAKELIKFDMYWYLRHSNIQSNGHTHFIAGHFLWQYKSSTGQNVRQIESCAGQNRHFARKLPHLMHLLVHLVQHFNEKGTHSTVYSSMFLMKIVKY